MDAEKRCCENCGNMRCANSIIAFWWDECVETNFQTHWMPKEEQEERHAENSCIPK